MGTTLGQKLPHPTTTIMRATAIVLLAVATVKGDSEAYTLGQVAYGLPVANAYATGHPHNVGVVTGVGYSGYGLGGYYGKREADAYTIGQVAHGLPLANAYATGHPHNVGVATGVGSSGYGPGYGAGVYYGKREAEAYTIGQVAYGGARGVVTGVDYGYGRVAGYGAVGNRGIGYGFYG